MAIIRFSNGNSYKATETKEKIHTKIKKAIAGKTIFIELVESVSYIENSSLKQSSLININHISKIF